jgi:glucan phosphorylase
VTNSNRGLSPEFLSPEFCGLPGHQAYFDCQDEVSGVYRDESRWTRMSILKVARMGKFSPDRAIREYCRDIWGIPDSIRAAARP